MQLARIIGHATSTVKHPTLQGWRLLVVQILDAAGEDEDTPFLAIDQLGSRKGDTVMITSDSSLVREMMSSNNTPVRWAVMGLADN